MENHLPLELKTEILLHLNEQLFRLGYISADLYETAKIRIIAKN